AYTPGGKTGFRPDYATVVYSRILKKLYPGVPVVIGGIEASLRRVTHYDYWSNRLKPSILIESSADLLIYGMGEQPVREILRLLKKGVPFSSLDTIPQTAVLLPAGTPLPKSKKWETSELASHEACLRDKKAFASNFKVIEGESNKQIAGRLAQKVDDRILLVNPPFRTMTEKEIDASYDLPYTRLPHPRYDKRGPIPAFEMIKFSITLHRGCFGGCSFCTISAHQGKMITGRSKASILKEVDAIATMPGFKGYISDLGGPSANMYGMTGFDRSICDVCARPSCVYPESCSNLNLDHCPIIEVYKEVADHPKVKKAFVSSGIRYDFLLGKSKEEEKKNGYKEYIEQVVTHHVSGRLKIAPEHTSEKVLKLMRKPSFDSFKMFKKRFDEISKKKGLNQQLIPYFISSHPGCTMEDMANLAAETKELGFKLEQVQDFMPTPMTLATAIYYSGYHPYTLKQVYTAKTREEKLEQNRFFFWYKKENQSWIRQTLNQMGRQDLIGRLLNKKDLDPRHKN
ncbi:MAG: YgiQ family radical SAM protein, partial [Candidatus Aminicenantaceae bacterium]